MSISPTAETQPIPGYTIGTRLGAGGYGEVWTAEAPGGLAKAIKFVYGYLDEARASRELKALNRIKTVRHPFLLSLERIEIIDGQLLIVTELADGSLKDRFDECRDESLAGIPREELLRCMADAAEALDYMNEKHGLQHLDVKPENLLMSAGRVKVADFGLVKDLQDVNVSLMGGLTPAYAAPEVFNSQPSTRSDQYSLAILFQEMLTGVLPFPGRSAAQLAAQHMSSRPNVTSLPEAYRPVILRALSKEPADRFASCTEMVKHLSVDPVAVASPPPTRHVASHAPAGERSDPATQQMGSAPNEVTPAVKREPVVRPSDPSAPLHARVATQVSRELSQTLQATVQPPHDTSCAVHLRPHLIVSVGGSAALTTQAFLNDMRQTYGELSALPAIQWLFLDADPNLPRELAEAGYESPESDRLLIAPLKKVQEYRAGSQQYLKWLSRRWLYNIPKSQTPESMRPLGRLAFVDKRAEVSRRIEEMIGRAIDPAAIASTAEAMGAEFDKKLRIVVVASASGGVGGGALLDIGDWIREVLAAQQQSAEVQALLLHGTGRQSNRQDLAVANTFATLSEVHDRLRREWAGEATHPLLFDDVNLHMLGEHMDAHEWKQQTRAASRFLSLLTSPAGARWDLARKSQRAGDELPPVHISSFQTTVIGKSTDGLTDELLNMVRAEVVTAWRLGTLATADIGDTTAGDPYAMCMEAVCEMAPVLHLTEETLPPEIDSMLAKAAGTPLTEKVTEIWKQVLEIDSLNALQPAQLTRALRVAQEFLGVEVEGTREFTRIDPLDEDVDPLVTRFVKTRSRAVQELISALADQPATGIAGANRAAEFLRRLLGELRTKFSAVGDQHRDEAARLTSALQIALSPAVDQRKKAEGPTIEALLMGYFMASYHRLQIRKVLQVIHALDDTLADLKRNLASVDRELETLMPERAAKVYFDDEEHGPNKTSKQTHLLQHAARELIAQQGDKVTLRIAADLRDHALATLGGFGAVVLEGKMVLNTIKEPLYQSVRTHVERSLQQIRLTDLVSLQQQIMAAAGSSVPSETAELLQCGGTARWLLMLPHGSPSESLVNEVSEKIQCPVAVDYHAAGEVTLFCLGEQIPMTRAAAHLIGHASQFAEIAERIHSRSDVNWLPLFVPEN